MTFSWHKLWCPGCCPRKQWASHRLSCHPGPAVDCCTVSGKLRHVTRRGRAGSGPLMIRAESIWLLDPGTCPLGLYHEVKFQKSERTKESIGLVGESWQSQVCPGSHSWKGGKRRHCWCHSLWDPPSCAAGRWSTESTCATWVTRGNRPAVRWSSQSLPPHPEGSQINWIWA